MPAPTGSGTYLEKDQPMPPDQPTALQPPEQPNPEPSKLDVRTATKWLLGSFLSGLFLGLAVVLSCRPDHVKDIEEKDSTIKQMGVTIQALTESTTSLKETVKSYEKNRKTRRTQKPALDGKGDPIRDAAGNPVILETVTTLSSESGSSRETQLEQDLRQSRLDLVNLNESFQHYKKTHEESRGGFEVLGGFSTDADKAAQLGFPPAFNFIKSAAQVQIGPLGEFKALGFVGLKFQ